MEAKPFESTPAATFRMIACWAEQAAQRVDAGEVPEHELVLMWGAIVYAHEDARTMLKRGLDRAQIKNLATKPVDGPL